jgi:anti-sigma regulatory factor (Ser/Thr protein kinase)
VTPACSAVSLGAVSLPGIPAAAACARTYITRALSDCPGIIDDAALCAGELVTNAVLHSRSGDGGRVGVTVARRDTAVRVEVQDAGGDTVPALPAEDADAADESGRGLRLVEAFSSRWGVQRISPGMTVVWFEIDLPRREV